METTTQKKEIKNSIEIDQRLISQYIETLKRKETGNVVKVKIEDYWELGCTIGSLIRVSHAALLSDDAPPIREVACLLKLAENIMPYTEMELLDQIK